MSKSRSAWKVAFTRRADSDILGIFAFIAERDGPDIAETILTGFLVGSLFHVTVWVLTRGIVWVGEFIEHWDK